MICMRAAISAGISVIALCSAAGAQAQSAPVQTAAAESAGDAQFGNEIVVTAQRRAETVQSVPISINAFGSKQLQDLRATTPADIATLSPGVFVTGSRGDQNPVFSIRGLSLNDTFSNNNPEVGIYFDDVILPYTPMLSFQMFDIQRVEVLKGPQGTLYGRNTTAGAINFISAKPTQDFQGYFTGTYARYGRKELEGAFGGGVTDTLAVRFSGKTVQQSSGWQYNDLTGQHIGKVNNVALRAQALWTPTERLTVHLEGTYVYDHSDVQQREHIGYYAGAFGAGGYCAPALAGYRDESQCVDFLGYSDTDPNRRHVQDSSLYGVKSDSRGQGVMLNVGYDLGGAKLTSITGYNHFKRRSGDDSDGAALIELDSLFTDKIKSFTQELRLSSEGNGPLTWVGGLYYSWDRIAGDALQALDDHIFHTRVDTSYVQTTKAYAAFGQLSYALTDKLKLTGGLRFTRDEKRYTYDAVDLDPFGDSTLPTPAGLVKNHVNQSNVSGKVGIDYKVDRDLMLYASASKGFKSGGFKAAIAFNPDEVAPFRGETVWAYEAGVKSTLMGGKLTLNAAGYYNNWRNFQAMVTEIRSGINVITLSNAGNARVYGGEVEAQLRPTDSLQFRASANWQSTKITKFNTAPGSDDYTGNRLANAPKLTASGQARWETPIGGDSWGVYILGDASYRSKVYFSLANRGQNSQDGYWLLNGRIGIHDKQDRWELAVFGKNILNKLYVSASYDNWGGIFPSQDFLGDPATYGVQATVRF
ncbi:TonB-dependent receptor [Flavisphingomonas formosensis]|uniref:TonB-dependent receptor n=1 Tax=Flavisphingomonas formosensis TaxID=861534 RepID=UPI0018DF9804|nr:TonB-dependent receptor [Sphingomonas formosensis]